MARKRLTAVLTPDNTARVTCPYCGTPRVISLAAALPTSTPVRTRVHCQCGKSYPVFLERRAAARYRVDISGHAHLRARGPKKPIKVRNLSRSGVLFELGEEHEVTVGDRLLVHFTLDRPHPLPVVRSVVVRHVTAGAIGATFVRGRRNSPDDHAYDLALALYGLSPYLR